MNNILQMWQRFRQLRLILQKFYLKSNQYERIAFMSYLSGLLQKSIDLKIQAQKQSNKTKFRQLRAAQIFIQTVKRQIKEKQYYQKAMQYYKKLRTIQSKPNSLNLYNQQYSTKQKTSSKYIQTKLQDQNKYPLQISNYKRVDQKNKLHNIFGSQHKTSISVSQQQTSLNSSKQRQNGQKKQDLSINNQKTTKYSPFSLLWSTITAKVHEVASKYRFIITTNLQNEKKLSTTQVKSNKSYEEFNNKNQEETPLITQKELKKNHLKEQNVELNNKKN